MVEATVVAWRKAPGDHVEAGEAVVEVETDKVELQIEAPAGGILREVLVTVDEDAAVGATLGLIEPTHERPSDREEGSSPGPRAGSARRRRAASARKARRSPLPTATGRGPKHWPRPLAGRKARCAATLDVTDELAVERVFAEAADALGGLDLIVANAGILTVSPLSDLSLAAFEETLRVNVAGVFLTPSSTRCLTSAPPAAARSSVRRPRRASTDTGT